MTKHASPVLKGWFFNMRFPNLNYFRQQWDTGGFELEFV